MKTGYAVVCVCAWLAISFGQAQSAPLAEILASEPDVNGIKITVPTGGCTAKSDFEVTTHPTPGGSVEVEFKRLKSDDCKGNFPNGLKLLFTWTDLKVPEGTKLIVKNPLAGSAPTEDKKIESTTNVETPAEKFHRRSVQHTRVKTSSKKHIAGRRSLGPRQFLHRYHYVRVRCDRTLCCSSHHTPGRRYSRHYRHHR